MISRHAFSLPLLLLLATPATEVSAGTLNGASPIVIAHRGASGYLPEHTLEAYRRAIELGADFIEPDLVMTKDGHLIARHEPMLDATTDVASKFGPERMSTRLLDGVETSAYFASDFTLAEIKTLRAIQPSSARPQEFNGLFEIPTLEEIVKLAKSQRTASGAPVGIYPEVKHSTFHNALFGARVFEDKLVEQLHSQYENSESAPIFIQSFEVANLQYLNEITNIRLVQLIDANDVRADGSLELLDPYRQPYDFLIADDPRTFADLLLDEGLEFIASYADGIGPWKPYVVKTVDDGVDRNGDGVVNINDRFVEGDTGLIDRAHQHQLLVHAYTFRNDASGYGFDDPQAEMAFYFRLGIDGVFTDFPDTGVAARRSIPEPAMTALIGLGLIAMFLLRNYSSFRARGNQRRTQ